MSPGKFYTSDTWLNPFTGVIDSRIEKCLAKEKELTGDRTLTDFACGHHYFGLHKKDDGWVFREWAPNATSIFLTGIFTGWTENDNYKMKRINLNGDWEIILPEKALKHGDLYKLSVHWDGGTGERIPSYADRVIQDDKTKIFIAQVWAPESPYKWKSVKARPKEMAPVIYEAHIGMATAGRKNRNLS